MKIEIRKFKRDRQLLIMCETKEEALLFDEFFGRKYGAWPTLIHATLTTDDTFNPYIRIEK